MNGPLVSNQIPNAAVQVLNKAGGFSGAWYRFFSGLVDLPAAAIDVASLEFSAPRAGTLFVTGGVVSGVTLTRGRKSVALGATTAQVPMSKGDSVKIAASSAPAVVFFPT